MWAMGSWLSLWISWGPGLGNPVTWEGTGGVCRGFARRLEPYRDLGIRVQATVMATSHR